MRSSAEFGSLGLIITLDAVGGELMIDTVFDNWVSPSSSPSDGVTSAYHSSPRVVKVDEIDD